MVDAFLSLDAGGWSLVLPQLNVLGFVGSPWETLSFLISGWVWVGRQIGMERGKEGNSGWYVKLINKLKLKKEKEKSNKKPK